MDSIGKRIKAARKLLKMTQTELADVLGYSDKTAISKIENGDRDFPIKKLESFASVLGVSVAYLMGFENRTDESPLIQSICEKCHRLDEAHLPYISATVDFVLSLENREKAARNE